MEELNFEKMIFGEKEEAPPKPLRLHWAVLGAVVLVLLILLWSQRPAAQFYEEAAPDMIAWRGVDRELAGQIYRIDVLTFTPRLDPENWGAEKIAFGLQADSGYFMTNISSANPNILTVDSGKSATWIPEEGAEEDYVVFTAWAGEHIVGYAVVRVRPAEAVTAGESLYEVTSLCSAVFPLVDGEYQDVTQEYIQQKAEELKQQ